MTLATSPLRVFPTVKRVQKLSLLQEFQSDRLHPVSVWRRLLGVMSSLSAIVLSTRLRMRSLQLRLNASGPLLREEDLVSWDDGFLRDLRWWSEDSPSLSRPSSWHGPPRPLPLLRRVRPGLGRCSRRSPPLRLMVSPLLELFDQPARVVGHSLRGSGFSALPPGSGRDAVLRQLHSPGLPPEARRDSLLLFEHGRSGTPSPSRISVFSMFWQTRSAVALKSSVRSGLCVLRLWRSSFTGGQPPSISLRPP